jgi:hypothetical protein
VALGEYLPAMPASSAAEGRSDVTGSNHAVNANGISTLKPALIRSPLSVLFPHESTFKSCGYNRNC